MTAAAARGAPVLTIDLAALAANWRSLAERVAPAACGAAVKADAYGLGMAEVAPALAGAGCRSFFVAHLDEGIRLRALVPEARIAVLHGVPPGAEGELPAHRLLPVLSESGQVARWAARAPLAPACLQLDSGMTRLGLGRREVEALAADARTLGALRLELVASHLAAADEPSSPLNEAQRRLFEALRALLPPLPASLANSSGIFLGPAYHLDLVRPGAALYGINPTPGRPNPMREVVRLAAPIVQLRALEAPARIGYGGTCTAPAGRRVATVAIGYADGYPRSLGDVGRAMIDGRPAPVLGRVSMDLLSLDVTAFPPERVAPGRMVDLLGGGADLDAVAAAAGTIGYELLTRLGRRATRRYLPAEPERPP
ncbi:MAG TPA: alanine racemase [Geminicoccaceae bacterium]|nr:alanine racemase [Geminicoccaceae bacterium]